MNMADLVTMHSINEKSSNMNLTSTSTAEMSSEQLATEAFNDQVVRIFQLAAPCIWLILVVLGLLTNGLVLFTIIKNNKLTNVTQCYLFNLALADVSFLIFCVPLTALSYLIDGWIFGKYVCKAYHYLSFVTVCAICLTLMTMTLDRYIYVCNIKRQKWRNTKTAFYFSCLIWMISFLLSIPNSITYDVRLGSYTDDFNESYQTNETYEECVQIKQNSFWSSFTQWYSLVVSYLIPLVVLIVCYIKILLYLSKHAKNSTLNARKSLKSQNMVKNKRVTKIVIFLTLTFMVNWFLVHFLATWYRLDKDFHFGFGFYVLKMIAHTMSYANSFINPIIYFFSNDMLKKGTFNSKTRSKYLNNATNNPPQVNNIANEKSNSLRRKCSLAQGDLEQEMVETKEFLRT